MIKKPKVMVLKTAGTNCDYETAFAFEAAGGEVDSVHINNLIRGEYNLMDYKILALPGGFTYGDDIASGKIFANELRYRLKSAIRTFLDEGNLIIGICNGFQILVKAGLLPALSKSDTDIEATLTFNDSGKFEDRWVYLKIQNSKIKNQNLKGKTENRECVWTRGLPEIIYLPVAHGEGKFEVRDSHILKKLEGNNLIVFRYVDESGEASGYPNNPNGSIDNIAGIQDPSGRILGLMPHPERHMHPTQHPRWTSMGENKKYGDGFKIFKNGIEFAKNNLM